MLTKNSTDNQKGQRRAHRRRAAPLADQQLVETGGHQGEQRHAGQVDPAEGQLHDDPGREPVGQSAHEGGRCPRTQRAAASTWRRRSPAGMSVETRFMDTTGPNSTVTGERQGAWPGRWCRPAG